MPSFSKEFMDKSRRRVLTENGGTDDAFARCLTETRLLVEDLEAELKIEREALEAGERHNKSRGVKVSDHFPPGYFQGRAP